MAPGQEYAHNRPMRPAAAPERDGEPVADRAPLSGPSGGRYVCPMHPDVVRDGPGTCPACGMALEPAVAGAEEETPELAVMTRRLVASAVLTVPLLIVAMGGMAMRHAFGPRLLAWTELALATPVVLWGGAPFFRRGWESIVRVHLNMFTLIVIGVGAAWGYSVVAASFRRSSRRRSARTAARCRCTSSRRPSSRRSCSSGRSSSCGRGNGPGMPSARCSASRRRRRA